MTLAEFLEWDDGSDRRYQLFDGVPVMMAPGAEAHGELVLSLGAEIRSRLKRPCRVISEAGITVEGRSDTYYVADLAVTCVPREPGRRMVAVPVLIVEVVSPSPGQVERSRMVADYRTLSSVREIVIAFHDERLITLQRRQPEGWSVEDLIGQASVTLAVCDAPIPLEALYRDLLPAPDAPSGA